MDRTLNPCDKPMARLKTRWPGMTRRRRTRAAVALETMMLDTEEQEEGEKVNTGLTRLQDDTPAGSWPRVELL